MLLEIGCEIFVNHENFCLRGSHPVKHLILIKLNCTNGRLSLRYLTLVPSFQVFYLLLNLLCLLAQPSLNLLKAHLLHCFDLLLDIRFDLRHRLRVVTVTDSRHLIGGHTCCSLKWGIATTGVLSSVCGRCTSLSHWIGLISWRGVTILI